MEYSVNPAKLSAVFMLPCEVVDKHIKLAGAVQLKVLLFAMRNLAEGVTAAKIADALSLPEVDVADALLYWTESGILIRAGEAAQPAEQVEAPAPAGPPKKAVVAVKPSREEVIRRGNESEEIAFLLREAQVKFGRGLRAAEMSTLVWLHDDEGMNAAVLLMLIEFAKSVDRCTIGYIERTALDWIEDGVETLAEAEEKICAIYAARSAWGLVQAAAGLDKRRPSKSEEAAALRWVNEWGFGKPMLSAAYDECVNHIGKFNVKYMDKVLSDWHRQNLRTPEEAAAARQQPSGKQQKGDFSAYDLNSFQAFLDQQALQDQNGR
ncbi:MAG: DnaD domain protein [Candidatus Howiella sp.]|jgi:DnaD/phage-associated family protein